LLDQLKDEQDRKIVLFSEWTTMLNLIEPLLEERRIDLVEFVPGHGQHHLDEIIVKSVQVEKDEYSDRTDALVAVYEGMVLTKWNR